MIMTLRSRLQGRGFRIVMGVLLVIIAIMWLAPQAPHISPQMGDEWIIDINGNKVSFSEFRRKYVAADQQLQMIRQQYGRYADYFLQSQGVPTDPSVIALNSITSEELLNQAARAIPVDLSAAYISQKLSDKQFVRHSPIAQVLPVDLIGANGAIDSSLLRMYLQRSGITAQQFDEQIEKALERFITSELVGLSVHIPQFQLRDAYQHRYAKKKFSVLEWSLDTLVAHEQKKALSEQELADFYNEQSKQYKRYWVSEKRAGNCWEFSADAYGITITDEEAQKHYERNRTSFVEQPVQLTVRRILIAVAGDAVEQEQYQLAKKVEEELKANPASFAEVAQKYSDDKETASNGGLMKPFGKGEHDLQFDRIAFLLKNDGDLSNIFKSNKGFEIVQRVSKTAPTYKSFASVDAEIKKSLRLEAFKKRFAADVAKLSKKPTQEQLDAFLQKHAYKKVALAPTEQVGTPQAKLLFGLHVGEVGSTVDKETGLLVQLDEIKKAYLPALDEVKEEVAQDLYLQKAIKTQQEQMAQVRQKAATVSFDELKKEYGLTLKRSSMVDLTDEKASESLAEMGVPAYYFKALEMVGGILDYAGEKHVSLVRLDEIQPFDEVAFNEKARELEATLCREEIGRYVDGFVASLHRNATINRNESIIAKLKDHAS